MRNPSRRSECCASPSFSYTFQSVKTGTPTCVNQSRLNCSVAFNLLNHAHVRTSRQKPCCLVSNYKRESYQQSSYMHTQLHACIHTCMQACMRACMHTYMHTCIHKYMRTCLGAHIAAQLNVVSLTGECRCYLPHCTPLPWSRVESGSLAAAP